MRPAPGPPLRTITPAWEQAVTLADRLTGRNPEASYKGSRVATKLKVMDVELAVMGDKAPLSDADELVHYSEPGRGVYKKLIIRVWALFVIYGACFGIELTINNVAAHYYHDRFGLSIGAAGLIAGLFGLMNIFARTLGGMFRDKFGISFGLKGRVMFMGEVLGLEGMALILLSQMSALFLAVGAMIIFSLFVQMAEGATFSVTPLINRRALGPVVGIVGAGGNAGAVAAGFLFRVETPSTEQVLFILGTGVFLVALLAFLVRFSARTEAEEKDAIGRALHDRELGDEALAPAIGD